MKSAKIWYGWLLSILFLALLSPPQLGGQTTSGYTCIGSAQVSVNGSCEYIFQPKDFLLEDTIPNNLKVFVFDKNPSNREIVECPGTYNYSITNERNVIICSGLITLIDDQAPVPVDTVTTIDTLECAQIDKILNTPSTILPTINGQPNPYYLGKVTFRENCTSCNCELNVKFFDQVDYFPCDSLPYFAKITRKWTATDCEDNFTQVDQVFHLVRPPFNTLHTIADEEITTCNTESVIIQDWYPFWIDVFGDTLSLNEIDCNLDVRFIDDLESNCEGRENILNRYVQVYDWCTGDTSIVDTIQIRYGDFTPPTFSGKALNLPPTNTMTILDQSFNRDSVIALSHQGYLTELSTGPMDCTISFPLGQLFLSDYFDFTIEECGTADYQFSFYTLNGNTQWQYSEFNSPQSSFGTEVSNVPPGLHVMIIQASDDCGNAGKGAIFFIVRDRISPTAKCIGDTNLELQTDDNGFRYQSLGLDEIDQNSIDNCQMGQRQVRRAVLDLAVSQNDFLYFGYDTNSDGIISELDFFDANQNGQQDQEESFWAQENGIWYTPWMDRVDFFCSDVNEPINVQVRFLDQAVEPLSGEAAPNESQCWLNVFVEDNNQPSFVALEDLSLECSNPVIEFLDAGTYTFPKDSVRLRAIHQSLGAPQVIDAGCSSYSLKEIISTHLDNCGFGTITRTIQLQKETPQGTYTKSTQQNIQVKERYDYWIKFPKDITANCSEAIIDSSYLEVEEEHCDLLAVAYNDEYYYSPQDERACFKIFRTYRVINWCEYNGTSAPVIVSRDWDTWNGFTCDENYNVNPEHPDGNNQPGDQDLYVIVHRNLNDTSPDTVYYDIDKNPYNSFPDDPSTNGTTEGYWWKVISGSGSPQDPSYNLEPINCTVLVPNTGDGQLPNVWGPDLYEDLGNENPSTESQLRFGSYGYWQYTQHILIYDDIYPEVEITGSSYICDSTNEDCLVPSQFVLEISDQCVGSNNLELEVFFDENRDNENLINYTDLMQDSLLDVAFPVGGHQLILWANDNCGNRVRQTFTFNVQDCSAPKPICKPGLVANLISQSENEAVAIVQAEDMIQMPLYDCAGQGPAQNTLGQLLITDYSINLMGAEPNREQTSLLFYCDDVRQGEFLVEIHAWDEKDLHDYCETIISVQDNNEACPIVNGMIAGTIYTEENRFIQNADVALSGTQAMLYLSDEYGQYAFDQIRTKTDYTVSPSLNSGFLNGISTLDILIIQNHILGREKLTSPYKLIAADINNSKAISTLDLIELRKLILSIDLRFKNNNSWRFIPSDYEFPNPEYPWQTKFPEFININNLQDSIRNVDFIGVKIGDVSGNVNTASTLGATDIEGRSSEQVDLRIPDQLLQPGQTYQIPIKSSLEDLEGMQFTLSIDLDKVDVLSIEPAAFAKNHYRFIPERGWVGTSWLQSESDESLLQQETCFILVLQAKKEAALTDILRISDAWLRSEAYQDKQIKTLQILPEIQENNPYLLLQQNYPNPFHESTLIVFRTHEKQQLQLQIIDTNGRVVKDLSGLYASGEHRLRIDGSSLPGPGLYFIKISDDYTEQTKRMIFFR